MDTRSWTLHAAGTVRPQTAGGDGPAVSLDEMRDQHAEVLSVADYYRN